MNPDSPNGPTPAMQQAEEMRQADEMPQAEEMPQPEGMPHLRSTTGLKMELKWNYSKNDSI